MFISFEGGDGSGKSTQIQLAAEFLQELGYDVLLTHEPGGTGIGEQIRSIVLDNRDNMEMSDRTELLLFCASRAQLVDQVLQPHLKKGGIVLSDRYTDSTLAYQGYGLGLDLDILREILDFVTKGLYPNKTIYLDVLPEVGLSRRHYGVDGKNRLDDKEINFHEAVYEGYKKLIQAEPDRFYVVHAEQNPIAIHKEIMDFLTYLITNDDHSRNQFTSLKSHVIRKTDILSANKYVFANNYLVSTKRSPIIEIEGIAATYAEKLSAAGVKTVESLLKAGATPAGRVEIAEKTGISYNLILEWVNHADLFRIKGVASEYADLLEEAGVDTVVELGQRNAENLYLKMVEINEEQRLVRQLPSLGQVKDWILQAKKLGRGVFY